MTFYVQGKCDACTCPHNTECIDNRIKTVKRILLQNGYALSLSLYYKWFNQRHKRWIVDINIRPFIYPILYHSRYFLHVLHKENMFLIQGKIPKFVSEIYFLTWLPVKSSKTNHTSVIQVLWVGYLNLFHRMWIHFR